MHAQVTEYVDGCSGVRTLRLREAQERESEVSRESYRCPGLLVLLKEGKDKKLFLPKLRKRRDRQREREKRATPTGLRRSVTTRHIRATRTIDVSSTVVYSCLSV